MILALALASSLWVAAQEAGSRPDAQVSTFVAVPIEKIANPLATDIVFKAIGFSADVMSTDWAISKGCKEGNPLIPRLEGRLGLKIGGAVLQGVVSYALRRTGHNALANVWRYGGSAVDAFALTNNLVCGFRGRK